MGLAGDDDMIRYHLILLLPDCRDSVSHIEWCLAPREAVRHNVKIKAWKKKSDLGIVALQSTSHSRV